MEFRVCSWQKNLMTKVKICGITNLEDALLSAKFGADALGFNFYKKSPRYIEPEKAREIIEKLTGNILKVGVFVNEDLEKIAEIAEIAKLDALQLHGEETPEFASELKSITNYDYEIIKAFRVTDKFNPLDTLYFEFDTILLDGYSLNEYGGTGEKFPWWIANATSKIFPRMYLAGGITPQNVIEAIGMVLPYGVDVCSGIEKQKGKKNRTQLQNFIESVRNWEKDKILGIYDLFESIKQHYKSYLGSKSLTLLYIFCEGFISALTWTKWTSQGFDLDLFERLQGNAFSRFVEDKLKIDVRNEKKWFELILEKTDKNEEKAFDLFFEYLEEFKMIRKISNE